jgi:hypothetical protein
MEMKAMRSRYEDMQDDNDPEVRDREPEVADGESVRVPLTLVDAQRRFARFALDADDLDNYRPHHARVSDAMLDARRSARADWIKQINDAWRTPQRAIDPAPRGSGFDMRSSDAPQPPAVMRRHPEPDEPSAADYQRRRDAIWNDYKTRLASAWKTDPNAAARVEKQAERWRHGR